MARNGSGTYNRAVAPYVAGTTITAATVNSEMDDIATALTQSLSRDGQSPATANIPMGGFRLTGLGNAVASTDAVTLGQMISRDIASLKDFGAIGDGVTNDTAAFTAAEASSAKRIYVPEGTYITSSALLNKLYDGPGKIVASGVARGQRNTIVSTLPTRGANPADYYGGDLKHVTSEQFEIAATVNRSAVDTPYYDYPLIQHFNRSTFRSGHSGYDADITGGGVAGTNTVIVNDVTPFSVGQQVLISPYLAVQEIRTISNINAGTGTITFTTPLSNTHSTGGISSVSTGLRTHTSIYQTEFSVEGTRTGGDFIAHNFRIAANPTHNAGRNHAFDRTTIGFLGGDAFALTDGVYIAGTEFHYYDKGNDPAVRAFVIDQTRSFIRENDTPGFGCVWLGSLYKSEGSKYCEAAHVVTGKWKRVLDTGLADLGPDQAALALKQGHRIYWGCSGTLDGDGFVFWSDTLGPMYTTGIDTGSDQYIEMNISGTAALRARSTGVAIGGALTVSSAVIAGSDVAVPSGGRIMLEGGNGDTYITFNGTQVILFTNGVSKVLS